MWGQEWSAGETSLRERSLVTVSLVGAKTRTTEMKVHTRNAQRHCNKSEELKVTTCKA